MTKIIFLGSMHDDPDGPNRLDRAFKNVTTKYQAASDFIGFEWAKSTYDALIGRRNELKQSLIDKFPSLKERFVARFANTLGYEGDLQQDLALSTKVIWMLSGRTKDDLSIVGDSLDEKAVSRKMSDALELWLLPRIPGWEDLNDSEMLEKAISVYTEESKRLAGDPEAMNRDLEGSIRSGREIHMLNRLLEGIGAIQRSCRFGVIVIGTSHLLDAPDSLFGLCYSNGFDVERLWPHEQ